MTEEQRSSIEQEAWDTLTKEMRFGFPQRNRIEAALALLCATRLPSTPENKPKHTIQIREAVRLICELVITESEHKRYKVAVDLLNMMPEMIDD